MSNTLYKATKHEHLNIPAYVIDIGTRDVKTSNSYPFIMEDWRTLLVEPNPTQIPIIKNEMEEIKGYTWLCDKAIYSFDGEIEFIDSENKGHSRIENENFKRLKGWSTKNVNKFKVKCITLNTMLEEHPAFNQADIVSIDVEGNDEVILKQIIEHKTFKPMFVFVEQMNDKKRKIKQFEIMYPYYEVITHFDNDNNTLYKRK